MKKGNRSGKPTPIIALKGVSRDFPVANGIVWALKNVDLDIYPRDFLVIYGPSGCGKSTLLNLITGIDKPTRGEVIFQDNAFSKLPADKRSYIRAKNFGVIYQTAWWVKSLNVLDNVALPLYISGEKERRAQERARAILDELKVLDLKTQCPTELSSGQQQRISLARALVTDPSIIVADEPTGNLDTTSSDTMMGHLDYLNKEAGKEIVLVTHNAAYWELGTRSVEMLDGEIVKRSMRE